MPAGQQTRQQTRAAKAAKAAMDAAKKKDPKVPLKTPPKKKKKVNKTPDDFITTQVKRVQLLETDMSQVKTAVGHMSSKVDNIADFILSLPGSDPPEGKKKKKAQSKVEPKKKVKKSKVVEVVTSSSDTHSDESDFSTPSPPKKQKHNKKPPRGKKPPRKPAQPSDDETDLDDDPRPRQPLKHRHGPSLTGYVDEYLRRENYTEKVSEGKGILLSTLHGGLPIYKPYMFTKRAGCNTVKQKLDVRAKLGDLEYIQSTLRLLLEKKAYDPENRDDIIRHLVDVTGDAQTRSWPDVLAWSQSIWDKVEQEEGFQWDKYQLIQNERFTQAMVFNPAPPAPQNKSSARGAPQATQPPAAAQAFDPYTVQGVYCRDFNQDRGCRFNKHHTHNGTNFLHFCSHCWSFNRRRNHSVAQCNTKLSAPADHSRSQPANTGFGNTVPYPGHQFHGQQPKNGQ